MARPQPRRAIIEPRAPRTPWQQMRAPVGLLGVAVIAIAGLSLARQTVTSQQLAVSAMQDQRTHPTARWGTRTPLPTPSATPEPEVTPTPTPAALTKIATPTPTLTPTPSKTVAPRATVSKAAAKTATAAKATTSAAAKPAGKCPVLIGGGTARTKALHQALCVEFPQVKTYGGTRAGDPQFHGSGRAIDVMVGTDSATGQAVANWARANASTYGITEVIWARTIWTTQRASEGWRPMSSRGSKTADHLDHAHLSVR